MPRRPTSSRRVALFLERRPVKIALGLFILISLLPVPRLEHTLRPLFILVFSIELALRAIALARPRDEQKRFEWSFFVIDLVALASFLPLEHVVDPRYTTWLLSLRLARLALLLRFARELASDVYSIVTRREQLQQFGLVTLVVWGLAFGTAVVLQHLPLSYQFNEGTNPQDADFIDRVWWAFRQLESADNLVSTVKDSPPIAVISLGLTIVGVFVVSFIIGIGSNVVDQVVRAERRRPVDYAEHSVVIGPMHEAELLVTEFVRLYERNRVLRRWFRPAELVAWLKRRGPFPRRHALPRMALLGTTDDAPAYLYDPMMRWVVYREGDGWDPEALARVSATDAKRAILLSRSDAGPDADAVTSMTLASFRAQNPDAQVFVEVMESENRPLMMAIGGEHTVPLDMPRFLGLFLCQHLVTPGVESLYTDLMTADGSEFYTHIFLEEREIEAVKRLGDESGYVAFEKLARASYAERGVILSGVFLGEAIPRPARGLVPVDGLVQWLNPLREPPPGSPALDFGAKAGKIPVEHLRGIIGVTATYAPLRRYGKDLVLGRGVDTRQTPAPLRESIREWAADAPMARGLLTRILVIGYSSALPSMVRELARFMPGVDATLILGERGDERLPLAARLASLGIGLDGDVEPPGRNGMKVPIEHGGVVTVFTHKGQDLAAFAVECAAKGGPIGAVVFLSEPEAVDRDARTAMRLLRFVRALENGKLPCGPRLHVLAEFGSVQKGEHVRRLVNAKRCGFESDACLRLSLVSTDRIKNYFMVHSAFVPGVTALYDEILAEDGQEIVRLEPLAGTGGNEQVRFDEIREALAPREVIPIAIERRKKERGEDRKLVERIEVLLNPPKTQVFATSEIVAIYALAESRDLEGPETKKARRRLEALSTPAPVASISATPT